MIVRLLARAFSALAALAGMASIPARADVILSGLDANAGKYSARICSSLDGRYARADQANANSTTPQQISAIAARCVSASGSAKA